MRYLLTLLKSFVQTSFPIKLVVSAFIMSFLLVTLQNFPIPLKIVVRLIMGLRILFLFGESFVLHSMRLSSLPVDPKLTKLPTIL